MIVNVTLPSAPLVCVRVAQRPSANKIPEPGINTDKPSVSNLYVAFRLPAAVAPVVAASCKSKTEPASPLP